ncbi:MAG: hypothetical protein AB7D06_09750 [Pedobacter sp.]
MRQQINLYQPALFEKKAPFPAVLMFIILGAVVVLALLVGALCLWRASVLETNLALSQSRQTAALQRIDEYQRQYPPRTADPVLARKVEKMMGDRQARLALLQLLTGGQPGNSVGFSRYLEGLAREDLSTVWLRRIRLSAGGHNLLLEGSATRAADVPLYLQGLNRQQDYAGREFDHLQLTQSEDNRQIVDFLLQTNQEGKP